MNTLINCYDDKNCLIRKQDIFVYDSDEPSNCETFKRLPAFYQDYICDKHNTLRNVVYMLCRSVNVKPVFTSGFRSFAVNKKVGGVSDSLHLYGLAVDFIILSAKNVIISTDEYKNYAQEFKKYDTKNFIFNDYTLIVEKSHFHFSFKRNGGNK